MRKIYAVIPALVLFFIASALPAAAPDPGGGGRGGSAGMQNPPGPPGHFDGGLKLSREQIEKVRELEARHYADTRDLRYDLEQKRLEMRKLFTDPKAGEAALLAKENEIGVLQQRMFEKRVRMKLEWRRILTAEQIGELDRMPMGPEPGPHPGPHMGPAMGRHVSPAVMKPGARD